MVGLDVGVPGVAGVDANMGDGGIGAGVQLGGMSVGAGAGANGAGGVDGGAGVGVNGGPGVGAGVGVNGGGADVGGGVGVNGGSGIGGGVGIGGNGGGIGLGGGIYLSHLGGASASEDASKPACTVQGGPARLLYFPPSGAAGMTDATGAATTPNAGGPAAAQTPITAWGQTFNPDYCYMSVETLYATVNGSGTNPGSTVGPTFTNAIFPFRSSELSTQQTGTLTGYTGTTPAPMANQTGLDFGALQSASAGGQIVAPARFAQIVPEWSNGLFWNMHFEAPTMCDQQLANSPPPSGGQPCQGCPSPASSPAASTVSPTLVASGYVGIGTPQGGAATGSSGVATNTAPGLPAYTYGVNGSGNGTSSNQPAGFTGAANLLTLAADRGWSSALVGALLCLAALL